MNRGNMAAELTCILPDASFLIQPDPSYPPLINFESHYQSAGVFYAMRDLLLQQDPSFASTISELTATQQLTLLLRHKQQVAESLDADDITGLVRRLKAMPIEHREIFRLLHDMGAVPGFPVLVGPFTVRTQQDLKSHIASRYPHCTPRRIDDLARYAPPDTAVVSIALETRDADRAQERADMWFSRFGYLMAYITGSQGTTRGAAVLNVPSTVPETSLVLSGTDARSATRMTTGLPSIGMFYLTDPVRGFDRIWDIVTRWGEDSATKGKGDLLERRILNAVEWVGRGMRDPDPIRAFVQYMIGLEGLFTSRDKDTPVTHRLIEFSAFVGGTDKNRRREIAREAKNLYAKRSDIAHGTEATVTPEDLYRAWKFVSQQITSLLVDEELRGMTDYRQLQDWVEDRKYW